MTPTGTVPQEYMELPQEYMELTEEQLRSLKEMLQGARGAKDEKVRELRLKLANSDNLADALRRPKDSGLFLQLKETEDDLRRIQDQLHALGVAGDVIRRSIDGKRVIETIDRVPAALGAYEDAVDNLLAIAAAFVQAAEDVVECGRDVRALACRNELDRLGLGSEPGIPQPVPIPRAEVARIGAKVGEGIAGLHLGDIELAHNTLVEMRRRWDRGLADRKSWGPRLEAVRARVVARMRGEP
jgi:hypothetical protein